MNNSERWNNNSLCDNPYPDWWEQYVEQAFADLEQRDDLAPGLQGALRTSIQGYENEFRSAQEVKDTFYERMNMPDLAEYVYLVELGYRSWHDIDWSVRQKYTEDHTLIWFESSCFHRKVRLFFRDTGIALMFKLTY